MTESRAEGLRRVAQELSALRALGRRLRDVSLKATLLRERKALALRPVEAALPGRSANERRAVP
jgi:hypothetical protein